MFHQYGLFLGGWIFYLTRVIVIHNFNNINPISNLVMKYKKLILFFLIYSFLINPSCKKLDKMMAVTTGSATKIYTSSAEVTGKVIDIGRGGIQHGHCFGQTQDVTVLDSITEFGVPSITTEFVSKLTNLEPATKYYVKAYIDNGKETSYGKEISFTTRPLSIPILTTIIVSFVTTTTASSGGNIESDGGLSVLARGVCWDISTGPTLADYKTTDGTDLGSFESNLIGLIPATTYFIRAYATNSLGTAYGNELSFNTTVPNLPIVSTSEVTNIKLTTAESGGNIASDGGAPIIARGICWSIDLNPTLNNSYTIEGTGTGSFISNLTGLSSGTKYHVRAYATNSSGTAYGLDVNFTTPIVSIPTVTTTSVSPVSSTGASSGGNVTSDGGATVTARGVCWNSSPNPTIADNKTSNGTGLGIFNSNLSGLTPNTTYYVCAYATNSVGTAYGNQMSFKTTESVVDVDGNLYNTVIIGTQIWTKENLKTTKYNDNTPIPYVPVDWNNLTTPAFCYYNNDINNKDTYGVLYDWHAVNTGLLCPTDWHVPTSSEVASLTTLLGGESVAGGKLKESGTTHWNFPNSGANNETGFTALPGGYRRNTPEYNGIGTIGIWWTSTESGSTSAWCIQMVSGNDDAGQGPIGKTQGLSVRCVKNN